MVFTSAVFIFAFLPLTVLLYGLAEKSGRMTAKNVVLLLASLVFYAWGGLGHFLLLLGLTVCNYIFGLWIGKAQKKKAALTVSIIVDLGVLAFFKYFNFFGDTFSSLWTALGGGALPALPKIALPIGISFFTFQIMSYLADVYREKVSPQRNFLSLALYIMLFPQLVAGPIVRYADVNEQIQHRTTSWEQLGEGARRFMLGFAKKVLLANTLGKVADAVFALAPESLPLGYAWLGILCYTLQIYMDFSAYSDMAIGMGRMFGFTFRENFDQPYISRSIREFWRRWHISLSSWFRDYVYIPLGGSRAGAFKTYRNLLIVFFLTGLWHGASWNFVLWGLWHGAFMLLERSPAGKKLEKLPSPLRWLFTMLIVAVGWVVFRADTLPLALGYLRALVAPVTTQYYQYSVFSLLNGQTVFFLLVAILSCVPPVRKLFTRAAAKFPWGSDLIRLALFFIALCYLLGEPFNPFIYFKF